MLVPREPILRFIHLRALVVGGAAHGTSSTLRTAAQVGVVEQPQYHQAALAALQHLVRETMAERGLEVLLLLITAAVAAAALMPLEPMLGLELAAMEALVPQTPLAALRLPTQAAVQGVLEGLLGPVAVALPVAARVA